MVEKSRDQRCLGMLEQTKRLTLASAHKKKSMHSRRWSDSRAVVTRISMQLSR
jgi:hypothetical protein